MADTHKYRTVYYDDGPSQGMWMGSVAVRGIGGGCTCGWQGQRRPDTADGGVQAFNDWWTDHYTPLVRPDPGELLILSHSGGMRCHYLAGRPVASGTTLELRLADDRWVPVRYEWSARADAAPRFYLKLGGPWETFNEDGPETYVMLPLDRSVFRWPVGSGLDLVPVTLEPMFGSSRTGLEPFAGSLASPASSLDDPFDFGRNGHHGNGHHSNGHDGNGHHGVGRDLLPEPLEVSGNGSGHFVQPAYDAFTASNGARHEPPPPPGYRTGPFDRNGQPGNGQFNTGQFNTGPFGWDAGRRRPEPPAPFGAPPPAPLGGPVYEPPRPPGTPPEVFPSAGDSIATRLGGIPMGNAPFVDASSVSGRPMDTPPDLYGGRPMDGRPVDGRPVDGRPMDGRPVNGRFVDARPMDGRPMDGVPLRPPPGRLPELPPPSDSTPHRTRIGRPPTNLPGATPPPPPRPADTPPPGLMNGNGSGSLSGNGSGPGGVFGSANGAGGGSIQDQVSRIMREATSQARAWHAAQSQPFQPPPPPQAPPMPPPPEAGGYAPPPNGNGYGPPGSTPMPPGRADGMPRPQDDPWGRPPY